MPFLKKIWINWKQSYNQHQKKKQFLHGLSRANEGVSPSTPITDNYVSFKHTGHAGDAIYSIPAMRALAGDRKIRLYFELNQPNRDFTKHMRHPNGNVMFTERSIAFFAPLIQSQNGIEHFAAWNGEPIHYDLTMFRELPFDYRMYSISRWYFLTFAINADLGKPWLSVIPDTRFSNNIVLARSSRYHAPQISYRFLQQYQEQLIFVGVKEEYDAMLEEIPGLRYHPVQNFYELAAVIAGSKIFIGNQSFPFSLAEALKVTRILEVYHQCPNIVPEGSGAYDFCYQPQFEKIVDRLAQQAVILH